MRLLVVVGAGVLAVVGSGLGGSPPRIEGRVVSLLGEAVADARVVLRDHGTEVAHAVTTTDGSFLLSPTKTGTLELVVDARGFARHVRQVPVDGERPLVVDVGLRLWRITPMEPVVLTGVIRDREGGAVADATVNASAVFERQMSVTTRTDVRGTFRMSVPEVGQYVIVAYGPRHAAGATTTMAKPAAPQIELHLQPLNLD